MTEDACCTCARLISGILPPYNDDKETKKPELRSLDCCGRLICAECIAGNERFRTYCPYCQISVEPSAIPAQGLREPPAYTAQARLEDPPAYSPSDAKIDGEKAGSDDVLHFINASNDSVSSLALAYGVPQVALRRKNNIFADHLLAARKSILIPGDRYKGGVSLSPQPIESEEEEIRKSKIRKLMVATKNADYDMAVLYLEQAQYNLEAAIESVWADEKWERENPLAGPSKGTRTGRRRLGVACGLMSQLS